MDPTALLGTFIVAFMVGAAACATWASGHKVVASILGAICAAFGAPSLFWLWMLVFGEMVK